MDARYVSQELERLGVMPNIVIRATGEYVLEDAGRVLGAHAPAEITASSTLRRCWQAPICSLGAPMSNGEF